ncbi:hypothetical protein ACGFIG_21115 [Micromonospora sp. NPDC049048]|uniref:hypothetical protein n=1 Tax=Micromonospora sp. NPDC049048 TaxID=3364263 RepID=UPI00371F6A34
MPHLGGGVAAAELEPVAAARKSKGSAFNPSSFYSYTLHNAADIPALLRTHAGPQASIGA